MCGIAGRVNAAREEPIDRATLVEATRIIAHRGPDGEGFYVRDNVGFGHRRLSIVDLAGGAQPMTNEDRSVWVVFNGEIYNHVILRAELEAKGHTFVTRSDTEVLVHGWEEWGEALPTKLRGMFGFALYDERKQTLFLARDRLGKKPVYWTRTASGALVFGSEIKSLLVFPDVERGLNPDAVPLYLALRYVPGPQTMFRGIERLQPGHSLTFRDGRVRIDRYWDVPIDAWAQDPRPRDEMEESETFTQQFAEAVRLRLMGEVPVGVFLSGGIDSTAVAWAMKRADPSALKSFSVGFDGDSEGELHYARMAAKAIGTQHREVVIRADEFHDSIEKLAWHLDEPNSDGACIPLMHLARRAREEVVVVLSGEGADEILGGYQIHSKMLLMERARRLGGSALQRALSMAERGVGHPKLLKYVRQAQRPLEQRYFGVGRAFGDALIGEVFGERALQRLCQHFAPYWSATAGRDPLNRMLYTDTKVWLPDDLLIKADKMTMAWAIELRVPFLDHELLESAWALPPSLKRRGNVGKYLMRLSMAGKIPDEILHRPKKGFPLPLTRWLRTSLHAPLRERLLASASCVRTAVGTRPLERLLDAHRDGRADHTEELYALWVLEEWHRAFLARSTTETLRNRVRMDVIPRPSSQSNEVRAEL